MINNLVLKSGKIKSVDLVGIINTFRLEEGNVELQHDNFMKKIRKEVEALKSVGISSAVNFNAAKYLDKQGKERDCFELTHDGMLEMLNSESAYCRYKTVEYINKLQERIKSVQTVDKNPLKEKEIEARYNNSLTRKANLYLKIAALNSELPKEYVQVLQSKAAETLNDGNMVIPLPKVERKTYTAAEIGEKLGITANKVGRLANENNLKTEEYGMEVWDKSKYSNKEVPTFRYYEEVIPVLKEMLI